MSNDSEPAAVLSNADLIAAMEQAISRFGMMMTPTRVEQANALMVLMRSSPDRHAALASAGLQAAINLLRLGEKHLGADALGK